MLLSEERRSLAARVAGFLYVFTNATAIFGEIFVRNRIIVRGDAARTAMNIGASERLFRMSIAGDLITVAGTVILIWALYVVLKSFNPELALLAMVLRIVENCVAAVATLSSFTALWLLSGADYLRAFDAQQLHALAYTIRRGQGAGLQIAFVFLGFGSAIFSYVWLKSRYIPRAIAAWGIFASLLLAMVSLAIVVLPQWSALGLTYMLPMGLYEIGLGIWLMFKGIRIPVGGGGD